MTTATTDENKPMRIAFFSGDITRSGGTENVSVMIANELVKDPGYSISFISLFEAADKPFFDIDERIDRHTVYPTVTHGIQHYFDTCKRLRNIITSQHVDVLIDIDGILDMYSLPLRKRTGVKVISWEHFNYLQNPGVPYRKLTRRWAARKADAIVTLTEADKHLYEENVDPDCPVIAIANPMQIPEPDPVYDQESTIIISSGRLTYQKGFDLLVDAAADVLPNHPDWTWLILGEGEDRPKLEKQIKAAGIGDQLILKGRVQNMDEYYRKAAMFVLSSRFEGLPMVLLEAKAYHLPIVSFDCLTGPAEIVNDSMNGYLVPDRDVDALADRVNELIDNADLRRDMSENTVLYTGKFNLANIVDTWKQLLTSLSRQSV